jgi:DNA polymerase-1
LGILLPLDEDSLLSSYALDERTPRAQGGEKSQSQRGIHGLKTQAREFEGAGWYEEDVASSWKTGIFDYEKLHRYNAGDAVYTWRRITDMLPKLHDDNVYGLYHDLLLPAARMFTRLQYRGIGFDPQAAYDVLSKFNQKRADWDEEIEEEANDYGWPGYINLNSWQQLSKLLYQLIGIEHPKAPSTARAVLEEIDHPIVDKILSRRTLDHMISVYLEGPIYDLKSDLRLHPDVLINGTVSGRLAYKNPPVGTLPKAGVDEEYLEVRRLFCAREGYVLLEADYAQAEMRIAAYLCSDPVLVHDLQQPVSVHLLTASRILGKQPEQVTEYEKVYRGKKVNFGILYGIGPGALSNRRTGMNCTVQEAQTALKQWHKAYSHYQPWANDLIKQVRKNGEVQTVTGRKRRVPAIINEKQIRQIINFAIQSPAGDYTLTSMIELEHLLQPYNAWPWFINHDSITFELPEDTLHQTVPLIKEVMERPRFDGWPSMPVEMKVGKNMLEMHNYHV